MSSKRYPFAAASFQQPVHRDTVAKALKLHIDYLGADDCKVQNLESLEPSILEPMSAFQPPKFKAAMNNKQTSSGPPSNWVPALLCAVH